MVDRLGLGVRLEALDTKLPADARLFESTKGNAAAEPRVVVDPNSTSVDRGGNTRDLTGVFGEYGACEAVGRVIGQLDRFVFGLEYADCSDRTKNFLANTLHVLVHVGENRWLHKEPSVGLGRPFVTASEDCGSLFSR